MTFILVISGIMIAFIMLLRYDIHKHKYRDGSNKPEATAEAPAEEQQKKQKRSKKQDRTPS